MIIRTRQEGNFVIYDLEGHLEFESTVFFQRNCGEVLKKVDTHKVIINMEKLKFVGSSGINQFIRVIKDFNKNISKPKLCKLSSEFEKVFKAFESARYPFQIFESENDAKIAPEEAIKPATKLKKKKEITN